MTWWKFWLVLSAVGAVRAIISLCTTGFGIEVDLHVTSGIACLALSKIERLETKS